jgi:purine-nucleoside phosphorylase
MNVAELFKGAKLVDFTGRMKGFAQMDSFDGRFVEMMRSPTGTKSVVLVDRLFAGRTASPTLVRDHLNLTGSNPLVGPNNPCGDRFPVVQGVYVSELADLSSGIAAGLKKGVVPNSDEIAFLRNIGADFCCYNIVPAMLAAAHAGWKVLAIALPDNGDLSDSQLQAIEKLTREN